VDELDRTYETSKTPEEPVDPAQADQPPTGPDALKAFIASGGTFGMAIRDTLAQAQSDPSGAAKMSGEHISNLLYGLHAVEQHTAPYTGRAYPNPNDYRERDTTATSRRRR
jgi:hypothetical protein